jgi:predicted nuclease of predicted toxin-antitoxin system
LKFLVDNALSPILSEGLRRAGHDSVHLRDYHLQMAQDEIVLDRAAKENRILISKDTDFGDLLTLSGASGPSVILFRRVSDQPAAQLDLLLANLEKLAEHLERGSIAILERNRIRVRALPLGGPVE